MPTRQGYTTVTAPMVTKIIGLLHVCLHRPRYEYNPYFAPRIGNQIESQLLVVK